MSPRRHQRRGLTLIEVVIALAIFSGVVGMLSQAVITAIHAMDTLGEDTRREQEFRFALRQILQVSARDQIEDGGDIKTLESGNIHWEAEVEETDILDLFRLNLTLEWEDLPPEQVEDSRREQVMYVLRPDWSYADERSTLLDDKTRELENSRRGL
ncbi:type II secretion system protein [Ruficoccus amylovorans]|uniref:Type II secretion system protein n=1 Tax=Ruficoccus amylovorans TaxID=1804625 RepID=A0A842H920_9BACT|nr:type II secretion system protein [Ruficoccus amylovorans]MBC2592725.1 type II secretion system protein [Ruficoccus amylovorans]